MYETFLNYIHIFLPAFAVTLLTTVNRNVSVLIILI